MSQTGRLCHTEKAIKYDKIAKAFHKHRGDVQRVMDEVGMPREYVVDVIERLRRQSSYEVSKMVVDAIMQRVLEGYNSRVAHLTDTLHYLDGREKTIVSLCCHAPVGIGGNGKYYCDKCKRRTTTVTATEEMVVKLKQEVITCLREEDIALVACADKMRYTEKFSPIMAKADNVNSKQKGVYALPPEADRLSPMGTQLLISRITQEIGIGDERKKVIDAQEQTEVDDGNGKGGTE